ncbi:hypothetical protein CSC75_00515 [Pseudoxanthomonas wuyuanensis]|nr:hypothetical protein CSC75_00515 [Pseudoxanthomonas wuyuanensis]
MPAIGLAQQQAEPETPAVVGDVAPTIDSAEPEAVADEVADEAADATEQEAEVSSGTGMIPAPPEGKGQIVFFREKKFAGAAIRYKVREGETELGKLSSGTYFVHVAEPGPHEYTVHSEAKDILNLEVEPGETYYVIGSVTMGFMAGRPNLSPSDEAVFSAMSKQLKVAK